MAVLRVEELYERYVRRLPASERLRLVTMTTEELSRESAAAEHPKHSLLELQGLGAYLWEGVDAQAYVKSLRDEWDDRR
jgi:hypothetical protein